MTAPLEQPPAHSLGAPAGIGSAIRRERRARKLTQAEFSALAGIGRTTLARYESGSRLPAGEELERILAALGWTLADLALSMSETPLERAKRCWALAVECLKNAGATDDPLKAAEWYRQAGQHYAAAADGGDEVLAKYRRPVTRFDRLKAAVRRERGL